MYVWFVNLTDHGAEWNVDERADYATSVSEPIKSLSRGNGRSNGSGSVVRESVEIKIIVAARDRFVAFDRECLTRREEPSAFNGIPR